MTNSLRMAPFLVPAAGFFVLLLLVPLAGVFWQSFSDPGTGDLSLSAYEKIVDSVLFYKVAKNTIEITALSTIFTLLLAYPLAYYLSKQTPRRRTIIIIFILIPFWTSILVKSVAFIVILGDNGIVNNALAYIGLPRIRMMFNRVGVVISMVHYLIPFMVFPILNNLLSQPQDLPRAAEIMGAKKRHIFMSIVLPLSIPGVVAAVILVATLSMSFFIAPALLGGRQDIMIANLITFYTNQTLDWQLASAVSVLLLISAGTLLLLLVLVPGGIGAASRQR